MFMRKQRGLLTVVLATCALAVNPLGFTPAEGWTRWACQQKIQSSPTKVYYEILEPLNELESRYRLLEETAIDHWNAAMHGRVKFVQWTSTSPTQDINIDTWYTGRNGTLGYFQADTRKYHIEQEYYECSSRARVRGNQTYLDEMSDQETRVVIAHELGHALGLHHETNRGCVLMLPELDTTSDNPCPDVEGPTLDEIDGIKAMYPLNPCSGTLPDLTTRRGFECA